MTIGQAGSQTELGSLPGFVVVGRIHFLVFQSSGAQDSALQWAVGLTSFLGSLSMADEPQTRTTDTFSPPRPGG